MSISPEISVAIISHGQFDLVKRLLWSLHEVDTASILEIIIIENDKRAAAEIEPGMALPIRFFLNDRPKGYAANVNAAFSKASGGYFCTINPDIVILQDLFAPLMDDIRNGKGEIVAPAIVDHNGRLQNTARDLPSPWSLVSHRLMPSRYLPASVKDLPEHPDWIAGMLLLMTSKLFQSLGGMSERYFLYFEDVEFSTRARLAGHRLYLDKQLQIRHDARRRSKRELRYALWHLSSAFRFFRSDVYRRARRLNSD